jgi:hypothetical protein
MAPSVTPNRTGVRIHMRCRIHARCSSRCCQPIGARMAEDHARRNLNREGGLRRRPGQLGAVNHCEECGAVSNIGHHQQKFRGNVAASLSVPPAEPLFLEAKRVFGQPKDCDGVAVQSRKGPCPMLPSLATDHHPLVSIARRSFSVASPRTKHPPIRAPASLVPQAWVCFHSFDSWQYTPS